jgi:hypothetical protein
MSASSSSSSSAALGAQLKEDPVLNVSRIYVHVPINYLLTLLSLL